MKLTNRFLQLLLANFVLLFVLLGNLVALRLKVILVGGPLGLLLNLLVLEVLEFLVTLLTLLLGGFLEFKVAVLLNSKLIFQLTSG